MNNKQIAFVVTSLVGIILLGSIVYWLRTRDVDRGSALLLDNAVQNVSSSVVITTNQDNVIDTDQDGLSDKEEDKYGTNKDLFDTDGDGYGDHEEVVLGVDPNDSTSIPIQDTKRIQKINEFIQNDNQEEVTSKDADISEVSVDSDFDTIPDTEETLFGTDPNKADTDGDGFNDADEIKNGYNPLGEGRCAVSTCIINE